MADDINIVQTTTTRHPLEYRSALKSSDINDFQETVVEDLQNLAKAVNTVYNNLEKTSIANYNDISFLRRQVDALLNQREYSDRVAGNNNYLVTRLVDFSDTVGITYPNGLNDDLSAMVYADFGQATLPANAIENRFYTTSARTGRVIQSSDLVINITSTFDKGEGEGLVDYERGGIVTNGKPEWAFNGNNRQIWIRKVEFPIDSKIDQVECELTVVVPDGTSTEANLIDLFPFPNGSVDVTSLSTSADVADSFTELSAFSPINNTTNIRYHFPIINVEQIKIRLRQRNWVEENGKKVFYYGLQELGLKLVDYDKTYQAGGSFGKNNSFIAKITAPSGYGFKDLYRIDPTPNFLLEDKGNRHIHLRISTTPNFDGVIWNSDSTIPPQESLQSISLGSVETIYAIFELNFVNTNGGSLSPYPVGTTPYVEGLGLSYTLERI
jgi:hypothetical protein